MKATLKTELKITTGSTYSIRKNHLVNQSLICNGIKEFASDFTSVVNLKRPQDAKRLPFVDSKSSPVFVFVQNPKIWANLLHFCRWGSEHHLSEPLKRSISEESDTWGIGKSALCPRVYVSGSSRDKSRLWDVVGSLGTLPWAKGRR